MTRPSAFFELSRSIVLRGWRIEATVRAIAGMLVLTSAVLALTVDVRWIYLAVFVGANLLQSSLSGWCLMSNVIALVFPGLRKAAS